MVMGMMNKMMGFFGLVDEEEVIETEEVMEESPRQQAQPQAVESKKVKGTANVVNLHTQKNVKVILSEPRSYEQTQEIAEHLKGHRPVIVNLQRMRQDQALRIIDFLSGTVYALEGGIFKVGENIFFCTPNNVETHGAITELMNEQQ
jgi:cell division inhibitor SepF